MYPSPVAVRSMVVIITPIGVVDDPFNITTTFIFSDNSEPVYRSDLNSTTNTTQNDAKCYH